MLEFSLAPRRNEMIESLCALIGIESVKGEPDTLMPYGKGVFNVLMKMLGFADHMDFDSVNLYSQMGYVDYGEGDETLAILTHLDVVPAGEGWTVPPFEGTVKDGRVYGRGAIDNKGPAVAALYALDALKENGIELNKRVRLLFGCDEESGWQDIEFYNRTVGEVPDMAISPDAEFPIINSEKGMVQYRISVPRGDTGQSPPRLVRLVSIDGGDRPNVVPAKAKCLLACPVEAVTKLLDLFAQEAPVKFDWDVVEDGMLQITSEGRSAHASKPQEGINAIAWLIAFLNQLPLADDVLGKAVHEIALRVGTQCNGKNMKINRRDQSGPLTLNMGYIHTKGNILEFGLDIRYPVSETRDFVTEKVKEAFHRFDVEMTSSLDAHFVAPDSDLVVGLKKAYEEITQEKAYCLSIGGATYARAFPNSVAFGPLFPGQTATEHQPDEFIEIDSFIKLADLLALAIIELAGDRNQF